jgi:DNA-binding transcriptional MerR regulator
MPDEAYYWCQRCGSDTNQVSIATAAQIAGVTNRTIYLWARQDRVHVSRINSEELRICKASLDLVARYLIKQAGSRSVDVRIRLVIKLVEQQYERDDPTLNKWLNRQVYLSGTCHDYSKKTRASHLENTCAT